MFGLRLKNRNCADVTDIDLNNLYGSAKARKHVFAADEVVWAKSKREHSPY
jgi:hypothetical protein